jgi:phosphoadenosine phosphosulfate reductase
VGEIRLGKIHLRWCDTCNVPVLEQGSCSICGAKTREMKITPPGDARPAFEFDIERIKSLIDLQFGDGTGEAIIPDGHIVILNKAPDIDRMDEVVVDGRVVGAVRFGLASGERFILRPAGAVIIAGDAERNWVEIDDGAVRAIKAESASTLAVGVTDCDPGILPGAEVIVRDSAKRAVSIGLSKMSSSEVLAHKRGTAVKTRWIVDEQDQQHPSRPASWEEVITANREVMDRRVREAKEFIRRL